MYLTGQAPACLMELKEENLLFAFYTEAESGVSYMISYMIGEGR